MGERAGNNVTHYSCFYGEKKKKKERNILGVFPLLKSIQCMDIPL